MTSDSQEFVMRVVFTTIRCSHWSIGRLFRLKRACKTEAYRRICLCISVGYKAFCFAGLFLRASTSGARDFRMIRAFACASSASLSVCFCFGRHRKGCGVMKKVNRNNGDIDVTTVGGRIKKLRTDLGMSQEELGFALHMEGKSVIYGYESNRRGISGDILVDLARILHSTPEYIMNGESPAEEDPYISAVVAIMREMKSDADRKVALEHVKLVKLLADNDR